MRTIAFLLLIASCLLIGQSSSNWGEKIILGTKFVNTDSTRLLRSSLRDTTLTDTLYSGVLKVHDGVEGIYRSVLFATNVGGTTDSLSVDVRLVTTIKSKGGATERKFGDWQSVFNVVGSNAKSDTVIASSTSAWWQATNGRQYRVYDESTTTDTATVLLTDFVR